MDTVLDGPGMARHGTAQHVLRPARHIHDMEVGRAQHGSRRARCMAQQILKLLVVTKLRWRWAGMARQEARPYDTSNFLPSYF